MYVDPSYVSTLKKSEKSKKVGMGMIVEKIPLGSQGLFISPQGL
jgi:hypothetical protein